MSFSVLFSKFKGLGPVAVVGTAVLVTVKLLTTQTPTIQESLNVVAEEDIKTVSYQDDIKEPEPEKQVPEEEKPESTTSEETQEVMEEKEEEKEKGDEESQPTQENQQESQEQPQQQNKSQPRKIRTDIALGIVFQKLLGNKKKQ